MCAEAMRWLRARRHCEHRLQRLQHQIEERGASVAPREDKDERRSHEEESWSKPSNDNNVSNTFSRCSQLDVVIVVCCYLSAASK